MEKRIELESRTAVSPAAALSAERVSGLAQAALLQRLGGYVNTQLIYLFARLGIADHLRNCRQCLPPQGRSC